MKLTLERDALAAALGRVTSVTQKRSPIPIMECVKLTASESGLQLIGSDMAAEICETIPASVERPGELCVSGHKIHALANSLRSMKVELDATEKNLICRYAGGRTQFLIMPAADYPIMQQKADDAASIVLPVSELRRLLAMTFIASSRVDAATKHHIAGIRVLGAGGRLVFVGTDGVMMVIANTKIETPDLQGVTIPNETCATLLRALVKLDGEATIRLTDRIAEFEAGSCRLKTKLIDADYVSYDRAMAAPVNTPVEVDAEALYEVARRVQDVTGAADESRAQPRAFKLQAEHDRLEITAGGQADHMVHHEIDAVYRGPPVEVGLSTRVVLATLEAFGAERLALHIKDAISPILVHRPGDTSESVTMMPFRV